MCRRRSATRLLQAASVMSTRSTSVPCASPHPKRSAHVCCGTDRCSRLWSCASRICPPFSAEPSRARQSSVAWPWVHTSPCTVSAMYVLGHQRTPLRPQLVHHRGGQEYLAMPLMARFPSRFAGCGCLRGLARLLVGRVRRRRPVGGRGVLSEASLQRLYTVAQLRHLVAHGAQTALPDR